MSTDKENLLKSGDEQINKLRQIVEKAIADEKILVEDFDECQPRFEIICLVGILTKLRRLNRR